MARWCRFGVSGHADHAACYGAHTARPGGRSEAVQHLAEVRPRLPSQNLLFDTLPPSLGSASVLRMVEWLALVVAGIAVVVSLLSARYARDESREARRANELLADQIESSKAAERAAVDGNRYRWVAERAGGQVSIYNAGTDIAHDVVLRSATLFESNGPRIPDPDNPGKSVLGAAELPPNRPITFMVTSSPYVGDGGYHYTVTWREGAEPTHVRVPLSG